MGDRGGGGRGLGIMLGPAGPFGLGPVTVGHEPPPHARYATFLSPLHHTIKKGSFLKSGKKCYVCGLTLPLELFYADRSRKDGKSNVCRECKKEQKRKYNLSEHGKKKKAEYFIRWRENRPTKPQRKLTRKTQAEHRMESWVRNNKLRAIRDSAKSGGCVICGYDRCLAALERSI